MEWLIAGIVLLVALTALPWWLATSSNSARRGGAHSAASWPGWPTSSTRAPR